MKTLNDYPHVREAFETIFYDEPYGTFDPARPVPEDEIARFVSAEKALAVVATKPVSAWLGDDVDALLETVGEVTFDEWMDDPHGALKMVACGVDDWPQTVLVAAVGDQASEDVMELLDDFFEGDLRSAFITGNDPQTPLYAPTGTECEECGSTKDLHDIAGLNFPGYEDLVWKNVTICRECLDYEGHPAYNEGPH